MTSEDYGNRELQLTELLERYRDACAYNGPDPNFMPALWSRIEARQSRTMVFARIAKSMAAAAAALSLALGLFLAMPSQQPSVFFSGSYVEAIATEHAGEYGTFLTPVRLELMNSENRVR